MKKKLLVAALGFAAMLPGQANASVYGDDLTKCLVAKTNAADQVTLSRWMFAAMSANPAIKDMAPVSDQQRAEATDKAGAMIKRLLTKDCRAETVAALKYDGAGSLQSAFGFLGAAAMRSLMADPGVQKSLNGLDSYGKSPEMQQVLRDAGLSPPSI